MTGLHQDTEAAAMDAGRKPTWLPILENELKRRVGWTDEAVSPFARGKPAHKTRKVQARIRHAA